MREKINYVRLPLTNADNVRDLGGLPAEGGRVTRWRTLLRSDDLSRLSAADIDFLFSYGVRANVDLRGADEQEKRPSAFINVTGVKYHSATLFNDVVLESYMTNDYTDYDLGKIYAGNLLACGENIRRAVELIGSEMERGAVVYNCTAGKDRTGIMTALFLGLAGVCERDIIANYEVTRTYIARQIEEVRRIEPSLPPDVFGSSPKNMEYLLGVLKRTHGGAESYLTNIGTNPATLDSIKKIFLCE